MSPFDATLGRLERSLDVRLERQNVLAGNIANVDTPGFVPLDVDFKAAMEQAQAAKAPEVERSGGHIALDAPPPGGHGAAPRVVAEGARPGLDGNAVDLDRTMVAMAQNALQYAAGAKAAAKKLAILRYVASDGAG